MKVSSIFDLKEIQAPTPIIKSVYFKSKATLKLYVVRETYQDLINSYISKTSSERCADKTKKAFANAYLLLLCMAENGAESFQVSEIAKILNVSDKIMTKILQRLQSSMLVYIDNSEWKAAVQKIKKGQFVCFHRFKFQIKQYPDLCRAYGKFDEKNPHRDPKITSIELSGIPESYGYYLNPWSVFINEIKVLIQKREKEIMPKPSDCISPYSELKLDIRRLSHIKRVSPRIKDGVFKWANNYHKQAVFNGGRWYHIFHQIPHELREYLLFNGSPLVEAFDLHNAFYSLMLFILKGNIPNAEYQKYRNLVKTGKFYEDVQNKAGLASREKSKEMLQRYRNMTIKQARAQAYLKPELINIDNYFAKEFPSIRIFLDRYPRKDGSKCLQSDMCEVECKVFQPICQLLQDKYGVTPFSLHDGIYLAKTELEKISPVISWADIEEEFIWSKV